MQIRMLQCNIEKIPPSQETAWSHSLSSHHPLIHRTSTPRHSVTLYHASMDTRVFPNVQWINGV